MFNKIFDDSQVVVFDEKGNIIKGPGVELSHVEKLVKDPGATALFETHELVDGTLRPVWYAMLTIRQRVFLLVLLAAIFFGSVWLIQENVTRGNEKYDKAVLSRIARGCKFPTMVVHGPTEGYAADPDEGCASK